MPFQIHALPASQFRPLFDLTDAELAERGGRRVVVDASPGYPCRVSLADAEVGETVLLVNHEHQPNPGPYRASHAIYVREAVDEATLPPDVVPEVLRIRLLSVRAFSDSHDLIHADVVDGTLLAEAVEDVFRRPEVAYLHVHNAKPGCFAARVTRADSVARR